MGRNVSTEELTLVLKIYMDKHPNLRLGQILVNLTKKSDVFYVEDDEIYRLVVEQLNKEDPNWNEYL